MAKKPTALERIMEKAGVPQPVASDGFLPVPAAKEIVAAERSTRGSRKAQLLADLEEFNVERLAQLREDLTGFVTLITTTLGDDPVLVEQHAVTLMRQALAIRQLKDLYDLCWDKVKEVAFQHFDASLAEQAHPDPQHVNAELIVAELGFMLRREGAGYCNAEIDEELLKEALGNLWKKVYTKTTIPAQVVYNLDEDALEELCRQRPELLEAIRPALKKGAPKAGRLNLRNI